MQLSLQMEIKSIYRLLKKVRVSNTLNSSVIMSGIGHRSQLSYWNWQVCWYFPTKVLWYRGLYKEWNEKVCREQKCFKRCISTWFKQPVFSFNRNANHSGEKILVTTSIWSGAINLKRRWQKTRPSQMNGHILACKGLQSFLRCSGHFLICCQQIRKYWHWSRLF